AEWSVATGADWLREVVLQVGARGTGPIRWDEANTRQQDFFMLFDAAVSLRHSRYSLDFWGRNLADASYEVFYFKSMGNEFVQRGRPRTMGITLSINIG
ncbi:MAG: TonB-dependent receptor, partial [Alistipes sp.]|nr:TonB-dependent receptor [Alistipes sp.]